MRDVFADSSDEDGVSSRALGNSSRIFAHFHSIKNHYSRGICQQSGYRLRRNLVTRLDMDGFGVSEERRNSYGRRIHQNSVIAEDFACLPDHFHFFFRIAVIEENVDMRDGIESNLFRITLDLQRTPVQQRRRLSHELLDGAASGTGYGLVSSDVDTLNTDGVVDRCQRNNHLNRRAI